jgi:hypothetical protein
MPHAGVDPEEVELLDRARQPRGAGPLDCQAPSPRRPRDRCEVNEAAKVVWEW